MGSVIVYNVFLMDNLGGVGCVNIWIDQAITDHKSPCFFLH